MNPVTLAPTVVGDPRLRAYQEAEGPDPQRPARPPQPRAPDAGRQAEDRARDPPDDLEHDRARAARPRRSALCEREALVTDVLNELFGLGPLEALLQGPRDLRHPRQSVRPGLHRARRAAGADRHRVQGRSPSHADHRADRQHRSAGASTNRAQWSTRGCKMARASTRSFRRWRWMARRCRSAGSGPTVSAPQDLVERESLTQPMLDFLQAAVGLPPEHHRLGRHRRRQDHAAERAVQLHLRRRADRDHRRRRRADAAAAPRRASGDAAAQHRRARGPCGSATSSSTRCVCDPIASSSARSAATRHWTCCRR